MRGPDSRRESAALAGFLTRGVGPGRSLVAAARRACAAAVACAAVDYVARVSEVAGAVSKAGADASPAARPRLLVLTPDFPPGPGGVQALTERLAAALTGFEVRVVTLDAPGGAAFDAAGGLDVRRVRGCSLPGPGRWLGLNAVAVAQARRFRPAAILSMHIVVSPAAALARRALGVPSVQYFHANEIPDKPALSRFAARHADATIAVSSYTAELLAAHGARPRELRVVPPGVDVPAAADEPGVPSPAGAQLGAEATAGHGGAGLTADDARPTVLTIARLRDAYKGHDVLLRALALVRAEIPQARVAVIGDGPRRAPLEALARELGLDARAALFLGAVGDAQRDAWLERADVFAMPSRRPEDGRAGEGFGIVYLEAAAHGVPVVAGACGGALDAVADGETGLLVDPTDARAVADALTALLRDPERAHALGAAGRERALQFAWPRVAARVEALLHELMARR